MRCKLYFLLIVVFLSLNLTYASIEFGNLSHYIEDSYTKNTALRGWLNFSLNKEPGDTVISGFNSSITLSEFIDKNNLACNIINSYECSCFPSDCESSFSTFNSPSNTKNYTLKTVETKLFGIKLDKNISKVTSFRFNISTNAKTSCINPLMIDLFDDGNIEFKTYNVSEEECFIENPYGCFKLDNTISTTKIASDPLCQKIKVPAARGYNIGANVIGNKSASFTMTFSALGLEKACTISDINFGGKISCKVVLDNDLSETTEAEVCISATEGNENKYSINFEDNETCGFIQIGEETINHDFEIFAKPLKYAPINKMSFSDNLFGEDINLSKNVFDYINRRYNKKCESGCVIPIRLYSGVKQNITLSDLLVDYDINGLNPDGSEEKNLEDIKPTPALYTSNFVKYNLELADILTPTDTKINKLELRIGNKLIIQNISLVEISAISDIIPKKIPALVKTKLFVILDNPKNLTYIWNFGDNSKSETTKTNYIEHTYSNLGFYDLTLNVSNEIGTNSKTFKIEVIAPFQAINETISDYKLRLKSINNNIFVLPDKVQERVSQTVNIADLKSAVDKLEGDYKQLFETESEELVKLMIKLKELNVPKSFSTSLEIKNSKLIQSVDRLKPEIIGEFGAGTVNQEKSADYYNAINRWIEENLEITIESKTYSFYFEDNSEKPVLSHLIINLKPKNSISELFMVIEGDINNIKFLGDYSEREINENNFGIELRDLEAGVDKKIEFLYPEKIESLNLPVYFSPEFRFLELGFSPGVCDNNNMCDEGENYKNCRADCKPIKTTIIFLLILFFLAFVIYIILQEWYKRNYEKHLFKNPNDLFNLISFMNNGENQNLSKSQIFNQLKQRKWSSEQLDYAWNKLHGKRTGMFEIPIFKIFEKRKIQKELENRRNQI
ncbi:MAG: PKD domain-containing protein [Nanoarchaeota archaeon]